MSLERLFSFSGRIGRAEYWLWQVGWLLALGASFLLVYIPFGSLVFLVMLCAYFLARMSIEVRRWHDLDKSGLWYFIGLVPVVGWLVKLGMLGFAAGSPYPNNYGLPYGTRPQNLEMRGQGSYQIASEARPAWMLPAASSKEAVLSSCPSCGKANPLGERFCGGCGSRLSVRTLRQSA